MEVLNDFKYYFGVDVFIFMGYCDEVGGVFYIYDMEFNVVDIFEVVNGERGDWYEFLFLENGYKIIGIFYDIIMNLSVYIFNGIAGLLNFMVWGLGIQEFDVENNLVWIWYSIDFVYFVEFLDGLNYNVNFFDYVYGNFIDLDQDGNLIVFLCNIFIVCKIDWVNCMGNIFW